MNALTLLCLVASVACSGARLLPFHGLYGGYANLYGGHLGVYPGVLPAAAPVTLKSVAPAPLAYNVAPVAPVAPIQSQYHAQDEFGQYNFGYAGGPSSRAETRDAFGNVRGSYNYIDADGNLQTQHYVADAHGFRVSGTNLPVAPDAPEPVALAAPGPLPEPVQDTPEVAAAKAAHEAAYNEAAAAAAAAPDTRKKRSVVAASPLNFAYGFSAPLNYAHPAVFGSHFPYTAAITPYAAGLPAITPYAAGITPYAAGLPAITPYAAGTHATVRDAELLRVVHNPGHAVSYRVD